MSTIPANQLVSVVPSVLSPGGAGLDITALVLTNGTRVPIGTVQSFPSGQAVIDYFGANSAEAIFAAGGSGKGAGYFAGYEGATKLPAQILFAQYNEDDVAAFIRGGDVSALTLTQLQAISGSLNVTVDGVARNAGTVNLSAATSFSSAAGIVQTALNAATPAGASVTAAIAGTTMTVSAVGSGTVAVGQGVAGAGVTAGTFITALGTGTGGTGTYEVSESQTVGSEAITTKGTDVVVSYDSTSGAFIIASGITGALSTVAFTTGTISASLKLTSATGAVLSQGAAAASPAAFMNAVVILNANWVTFTTTFDPDGGSGNSVKQAFADWKNGAFGGNRFAYVCWDTDASPTATVPATSSLGYLLEQEDDSGTFLLYEPSDLNQAAFVCGAAASIDFTATNGRLTFAFRSQQGLVAGVTDPVVAQNLGGNPQVADSFGNGYNFYGAYAGASTNFTWLQRGTVTGPFKWFDSYINQIWMNNAFQNAILNLFGNAKSIPYGSTGNSQIEAALADPINAALNFGVFGPGTLSQSQIASVNAQAGLNIAGALQAQGYYLQIKEAAAATRASRTTPPATFWYIDKGSVQALNLSSIELQ